MAGLPILLPMLHPGCYHPQRTIRGRCDWLDLHRKTLSFSTSSRFIPALSMSHLLLKLLMVSLVKT